MVSTRRQSATAEQNGAGPKTGKSNGATPSKRKAQEAVDAPKVEKNEEEPKAKQQKTTSSDEKSGDVKQDGNQKNDTQKEDQDTQEAISDSKPSTAKDSHNEGKKEKLQRLVSSFGQAPLQHLIPKDASGSQIVMIHILNALLASARVSHTIAGNTLECLIKENYQDLKVLESSSWDERCKVLTEGGYTRYREKTATYLGELSDLMKAKYDNDGEKMLPKDEDGQKARDTLHQRLEEIKGLGPVGIDIFLGAIQSFFSNVAPFLDKRSRDTADKIGLGDDVDGIFEMVNKKAEEMAKVEVALTMVRLDKKEAEFE